jgi:hypothetical protein
MIVVADNRQVRRVAALFTVAWIYWLWNRGHPSSTTRPSRSSPGIGARRVAPFLAFRRMCGLVLQHSPRQFSVIDPTRWSGSPASSRRVTPVCGRSRKWRPGRPAASHSARQAVSPPLVGVRRDVCPYGSERRLSSTVPLRPSAIRLRLEERLRRIVGRLPVFGHEAAHG